MAVIIPQSRNSPKDSQRTLIKLSNYCEPQKKEAEPFSRSFITLLISWIWHFALFIRFNLSLYQRAKKKALQRSASSNLKNTKKNLKLIGFLYGIGSVQLKGTQATAELNKSPYIFTLIHIPHPLNSTNWSGFRFINKRGPSFYPLLSLTLSFIQDPINKIQFDPQKRQLQNLYCRKSRKILFNRFLLLYFASSPTILLLLIL